MAKQEGGTVVKCGSKEEYMKHVKNSIAEFALEVAETPEVYGALCVIDLGNSAQVYQLGNEASLRDISQHVLQLMEKGELRGGPSKAIKINALGLGIAIFGLGILVGFLL